MKIREFAEEKGLTKQAVYKAISRAGFSAKDLTDRSGNLSKKGMDQLKKLFPDDQEKDQDQEQSAPQPDSKTAESQGQEQISHLSERIKALETEVAEWKQRYFDLVDSSNSEREQLRILIDQEQKLRAAAENRGFLKRLFSGKKSREGE